MASGDVTLSPCCPAALCILPVYFSLHQSGTNFPRHVPPLTFLSPGQDLLFLLSYLLMWAWGAMTDVLFKANRYVSFLSQASVPGQAEVLDALCPRDAGRLHRHVLLCGAGQFFLRGPHSISLDIPSMSHSLFHDSSSSYDSGPYEQTSARRCVRLMCHPLCTQLGQALTLEHSKTASNPLKHELSVFVDFEIVR